MRTEQLRDKYLGVALGLACGDAMGLPLADAHRYQLESRYGIVKELLDAPEKGVRAGDTGTATFQALALLDSYLMCRGYDGEDLALRLVDLLEAKGARLAGETRDIIGRFAEDPDCWQTAAREIWYDSAATFCANGALVRAPIIALRNPNSLDNLVEDSVRATQITHFDPRCVEATLAIAFMVSQMLHGRFGDGLLEQTITFVENLRRDPKFQRLVHDFDPDTVRTMMNLSPLPSYFEDRDAIVSALREVKTLTYENLGSSPSVVHTLQTSVWTLFNSVSFEVGVGLAVSIGGEADMQGAVAGALLGARFGMNEIPVRWLKDLSIRPRISNQAELLLSETQGRS